MSSRITCLFFLGLLFFQLAFPASLPDMKPYFLKLSLASDFHDYHQNDVIQFELTFKNTANRNHTIILPGKQNRGKKMVYLSFYTVDANNHYTEIARESREIIMDTSGMDQPFFKTLDPGDSVRVPIFLNDTANYGKHIQANHNLPDLAPGEYKVLAWYNPMDQEWAPKLFNKISGFSRNDSIPPGQKKLNIPEGGLISNYLDLTILPGKSEKVSFYRTTKCDQTCGYCDAIENDKWQKVELIIDKQTFYSGKENEKPIDTMWSENHCNVAFVFDGPDAILSSLPTYTNRRIIFRNRDGYHYFLATWQLGIIYENKARVSSILNWLAPFPLDLKTSEVDYQKLVKFDRY